MKLTRYLLTAVQLVVISPLLPVVGLMWLVYWLEPSARETSPAVTPVKTAMVRHPQRESTLAA